MCLQLLGVSPGRIALTYHKPVEKGFDSWQSPINDRYRNGSQRVSKLIDAPISDTYIYSAGNSYVFSEWAAGPFWARRMLRQTNGPVEKHQFSPAASFMKPGNDANREPENWTFSTGPNVSSYCRTIEEFRNFGRCNEPPCGSATAPIWPRMSSKCTFTMPLRYTSCYWRLVESNRQQCEARLLLWRNVRGDLAKSRAKRVASAAVASATLRCT